MKRRECLATVGSAATVAAAGCLDRVRVRTSFELEPTDVAVDAPPAATLADGTVTARGTVRYGSSDCGTVELAHANYERSQDRLDLLVVAADDSWPFEACNDDVVTAGYRLEASVRGGLRRATVTEHHVREAYSTTVPR